MYDAVSSIGVRWGRLRGADLHGVAASSGQANGSPRRCAGRAGQGVKGGHGGQLRGDPGLFVALCSSRWCADSI
jgi:hypothetical protein